MWTHLYDLLAKISSIFISTMLISEISFEFSKPYYEFIASMLFAILFYVFFLRTLSSYLYCKLNLKMNLSFKEAKKFNKVLSPNPFTLKKNAHLWLPLKEVKLVPVSEKMILADKLVANWLENN